MYKHVISALYVYRLNAFRKSEAIKIFYYVHIEFSEQDY